MNSEPNLWKNSWWIFIQPFFFTCFYYSILFSYRYKFLACVNWLFFRTRWFKMIILLLSIITWYLYKSTKLSLPQSFSCRNFYIPMKSFCVNGTPNSRLIDMTISVVRKRLFLTTSFICFICKSWNGIIQVIFNKIIFYNI